MPIHITSKYQNHKH